MRCHAMAPRQFCVAVVTPMPAMEGVPATQGEGRARGCDVLGFGRCPGPAGPEQQRTGSPMLCYAPAALCYAMHRQPYAMPCTGSPMLCTGSPMLCTGSPMLCHAPAAHTAPRSVAGTDCAPWQSVVSVPHAQVGGWSHSPSFALAHESAVEVLHVANA